MLKQPARALAAAALVLIAGASACTGSNQPEAVGTTAAVDHKPQRYVPTEDVIVTRNSDELPSRCSPRDVAGLITNFFDAFNRRDAGVVDRFIASDGRFGWYSITEGNPDKGGRHFFTEDVDRLRSYFQDRYRHGERLKLLLVDVGADTPKDVGIHFVIRRDADDLKPGWGARQRIAEGKGTIDCVTQTIRVWSAGMDPARAREFPPYVSWSCPRPDGWRPAQGPILACTRA